MNVIKVSDTFILGNGSPGPGYSHTCSPRSMKCILISPPTQLLKCHSHGLHREVILMCKWDKYQHPRV